MRLPDDSLRPPGEALRDGLIPAPKPLSSDTLVPSDEDDDPLVDAPTEPDPREKAEPAAPVTPPRVATRPPRRADRTRWVSVAFGGVVGLFLLTGIVAFGQVGAYRLAAADARVAEAQSALYRAIQRESAIRGELARTHEEREPLEVAFAAWARAPFEPARSHRALEYLDALDAQAARAGLASAPLERLHAARAEVDAARVEQARAPQELTALVADALGMAGR